MRLLFSTSPPPFCFLLRPFPFTIVCTDARCFSLLGKEVLRVWGACPFSTLALDRALCSALPLSPPFLLCRSPFRSLAFCPTTIYVVRFPPSKSPGSEDFHVFTVQLPAFLLFTFAFSSSSGLQRFLNPVSVGGFFGGGAGGGLGGGGGSIFSLPLSPSPFAAQCRAVLRRGSDRSSEQGVSLPVPSVHSSCISFGLGLSTLSSFAIRGDGLVIAHGLSCRTPPSAPLPFSRSAFFDSRHL